MNTDKKEPSKDVTEFPAKSELSPEKLAPESGEPKSAPSPLGVIPREPN